MRTIQTIVILAAVTFFPASTLAQSEATKGVIEGTVRNETGSPLPAAFVTIINQDNGAQRRMQTDSRGAYRSPSLTLGNYQVVAEREGFLTMRRTGIVLQIAQTLNVSFKLTQASGEAVLVTARQPILETDRKQPSTTLNRRFVD
jgi:hypothetical protein